MENNKNNDLWWRPAVAMFANISGCVAGPIIIALIIGKYLDKRYDSEPWFFIGLTAIAFIVSIVSIWKILKKYIKEIEEEAKNKKLHKLYSEKSPRMREDEEPD